jgi:hypothetical protein
VRIIFFLLLFLNGFNALAREITFSWEPFENVYAYEIRISQDQSFTESLLRKGTKKPSFTADLPIGKYFYKVRALDQHKRPGQWSDAVPFVITPYPPELKSPKSGILYSYFEIPPTIDLEWKPVDGDLEYEVLIAKTTGLKVLESRTKQTKFSTSDIVEGEYTWKVRTIYKEIYESAYTEPKFFNIEKKEFAAPILIEPASKRVLAAYRPVEFTWKNDPNMKYSDILIESKSLKTSWDQKDLKSKEAHSIPYMEPGEYQWTVTNKEAATTPGMTAKLQDFEVRNDLVASGNTQVSMAAATSFYIARGGGQEYARSNLAYYLGLKYYPGEFVGFSLEYQTSPLDRAPYSIPYQRTSASVLLRGGTVGFAQDFMVGARSMDLALLDPTSNAGYVITYGLQVGLSMYGTIARGWKFLLAGLYYKPVTDMYSDNEFMSDHYEFELGFSYNVFDQFWLSYKARSEKTVTSFDAGSGQTGFEAVRTEPIHLMFSWEY